MPNRPPSLTLLFRPRGLIVAGLTIAVAVLAIGCDYQLQLQPTGTPTAAPAGTLHVRQVPGQPTPPPAEGTPTSASIAALVQQYLSANGAGAAPAAGAPAANGGPASIADAPAAAPPPVSAAPAVSAPPAVAAVPAAVSAPAGAATRLSDLPAAALVTPPSTSAPLRDTASPITRPAATPTPGQSAAFSSAATPPAAGRTANRLAIAVATPAPTPPPTAAPTASPTLAPTPPPTQPPAATSKPASQAVSVYLHEGMNDFIYAGPSLPANQALAHLAGRYEAAYFQPAGASQMIIYRPGIDPPAVIPTGAWLKLNMKPGENSLFAMLPPN